MMKINKESVLKKQISLNNIVIMLYLLTSFILTIPSIMYIIKNKTIYNFSYAFRCIFENKGILSTNYFNGILFITLFSLLFLLYFIILKNIKNIFNTKIKLFAFIVVTGILFMIMIPTTSWDVYSYIGNGWVDSNYNENPYYVSVQDVINENGIDEMLGKVARCWLDEPVIYGPIWSLICRILTSISFGNITFSLYTFKFTFLIVYILSSLLIYKITNKKLFTAMFALNPFILFEFLSNVHNDIFLVFFVLLAIYFIKNKNNTFMSVACIAIATGIKYLSILLLPFILIYALRKENLKNRIIKCILYGIEFIALLFIFYVFYVRDLKVLSGIFIQQNKYGRSIFLILWYLLNGNAKVLDLIKLVALLIFACSYIGIVLKLFFNKNNRKINFIKTMRVYQIFLVIFTFVLITNFNPWYVIWLFPTLFYQKAKNIRLSLYLSYGALTSYGITYLTGIDDETVGIHYLMIMIISILVLEIINSKLKEVRKD